MKAIQYACFGGLGVLENGLKAGEITSFVAAVLPLRPAVEAHGRRWGREVRGPNGVRVRRGTGLPDGRTSPGELIAEGHSACFSKVLANMPSEAGQQNREVDIGASMFDLDQVIRLRHSTRMFLPQQPVPRELIDEALALAVRAPSDPTSSRGRWCSRPERPGTVCLRPCSTRPAKGDGLSGYTNASSRTVPMKSAPPSRNSCGSCAPGPLRGQSRRPTTTLAESAAHPHE
jgi:hypothetical protein